jgi:hypothetical protein
MTGADSQVFALLDDEALMLDIGCTMEAIRSFSYRPAAAAIGGNRP